jgi:hypothetical protein
VPGFVSRNAGMIFCDSRDHEFRFGRRPSMGSSFRPGCRTGHNRDRGNFEFKPEAGGLESNIGHLAELEMHGSLE